ncbi:coiled-coil domain-containing protein 138 [Bombina bombina]|uniref:coiled-coil domain-containing protein 138 n=1 Tax=Bombina bombina TaxID=8345 RepID=UPI00235A7DD9|nr:coiled-coil domain-containing protein 138 [Bombina bombina]XP_053563590.1 coiled-coil domain-containing protein 138 [Bombina bombina]
MAEQRIRMSPASPSNDSYYNKALQDLLKMIQNTNCGASKNEHSYDSSHLDTSDDNILDDQAAYPFPDFSTHIYTETDVTLPSHLAANSCNEPSVETSIAVIPSSRKAANSILKGLHILPSEVHEIYDELFDIYQKLQSERISQQKYSLELKKRERRLRDKEELLFKHQATVNKIKGVEETIHAKFQIMKERHEAEVKQLSEALKEKIKENKRLKSSFDTLKEMNDSLKKQLNEVSEENKKLEAQARKVQARLENLQKKHAFINVQKCKNVSYATRDAKSEKSGKASAASAKPKVPTNMQVYELLTILMDWISDLQISPISGENGNKDKSSCANKLSTNCFQDKYAKILPIIVEQFQWMPLVNPKLHFPFVKFIYWNLKPLETGTQITMTSTLRRLGEEIYKGAVFRASNETLYESVTESERKFAAFFTSNHLPLRFISTLIILKTVNKVDYLAQALDALCMDLKTDEGRDMFIEYQAVTIVLNLLHLSNRGLVSSVLDILLQLSMEARFMESFLETCSTESFFKTSAALLRDPKVDVQILEKLSIIMQKLSKIKSNKKFFQLFSIPLLIQEMQRTANSEHAFLVINLNSILFHLGLAKTNSSLGSASASH